MKIKGAVISDVHFGVIDDIKLSEEFNDVFIHELSNMDKLDFIIIDGDWYDTKMFLNNRTSDVSFNAMSKIVEIARKNNSKIRIVYGTESHDADQYKIFNVFDTDPTLDFRVIYNIEEEELFPDVHVLYIPEEVVTNKSDYYMKYLKNKDKYNYVFGHGVIQEVMTNAVKHMDTKDTTRPKVPVFTTAELMYMCKGQTYFGHYHINTNYNDRVFYVGSFTRWCFGEEEPKGFYITEYNTEKDKYQQQFIQNYKADVYKTYFYGYDAEIFQSQDKLISTLDGIDKLQDCEVYNKARLMLNIPEDHPNPQFIIDYLKERYKFNNTIKVVISNGYNTKRQKQSKEQIKNLLDTYSCIFDKSVPLERKLSYFIETKFESNIKVEMIKTILYGNIIYDTTGDDI